MKKNVPFLLLSILYILSSCKESIKNEAKDELKKELLEKVEEYKKNEGRFELVSSKFEFIRDDNFDKKNFNYSTNTNNVYIKYSIVVKNISDDILIKYKIYSVKAERKYSYKGKTEEDLSTYSDAGKRNFTPDTQDWKPGEVKTLEGIQGINVGKSKYETEEYWTFESYKLYFSLISSTPIANSHEEFRGLDFDLSDQYQQFFNEFKNSSINK